MSDVALPPELVGHPHYRVERELGRGGMGVVYLARNLLLDRPEVLKVIARDLLAKPGVRDRFVREMRSAARLSHPNIVTAYAAVADGDFLALAMEYVTGASLDELVRARGPLPVRDAAGYAYQAALGLQHAHEKGMAHRDIKPGNLMVTEDGRATVVKVLDFGLAKATREKSDGGGLTASGVMLGTPAYAAPEQTRDAAAADIQADVYSLGCTLYHLLTGEPPFHGGSLYSVLYAHQNAPPPDPREVRPDVPPALSAVLARMMAKLPGDRYATPAEAAEALAPFASDTGSAPPAREVSKATETVTRTPTVIPVAPPRPAEPDAFTGLDESAVRRSRATAKPGLPGWVGAVSAGGLAVVVVAGAILYDRVQRQPAPPGPIAKRASTAAGPPPVRKPPPAVAEPNPGDLPTVKVNPLPPPAPPPGVPAKPEPAAEPSPPAVVEEKRNVIAGVGGAAGAVVVGLLAPEANLWAEGGNERSEEAVARGLVWLARRQRANGSWVYDGKSADDTIAATGMGLLPFLAAGHSHKKLLGPVRRDYSKVVAAGLDWLLRNQQPSGTFTGSSGMYAHAIATIALCEAYGMTRDKVKLLYPCQRAVSYILSAQASNGSWGYGPRQSGDTSIVGWQVQALKSAERCKDLVIDKKVLERTREFLDSVSDPSKMVTYGYREPPGSPGTALTAAGLLCRYHLDGWGPIHPGMAAGVKGLVTLSPPGQKTFDMYYYYYATQVVHLHKGDVWFKGWNPKMRDLLVNLQVAGKGERLDGSWDPDRGEWIGPHCGRLGTTALALLTLEVYYRHQPPHLRGPGGRWEPDRKK